MRLLARLLVMLLFGGLLGGCAQQDMSDLRAFVAEVQSRPATGITSPPEPLEVETFLYRAADRRDPFVAQIDPQERVQEIVDNGIAPDLNRRKEALEAYSLDSLRMVGTLQQEQLTWGLVQTQDGTIHRVALGNYIGLNHGRIVQIAEDEIQLVELVRLGAGYEEQEAALKLGGGG